MEHYTQKQLRALVASGAAIDLTHETDYKNAPSCGLRQIGYSAGVYGCNGKLLQDEHGKLYAITARTPAIYLF